MSYYLPGEGGSDDATAGDACAFGVVAFGLGFTSG